MKQRIQFKTNVHYTKRKLTLKKITPAFKLTLITSILGFSSLVSAVPVDGDTIIFTTGEPYNNPISNTITFNSVTRSPGINNDGRILLNTSEFYFMGNTNNNGLIDSISPEMTNFFIGGVFNNSSSGIVNLRGDTIEMPTGTINNYGTINIIPLFGDDFYYPQNGRKQLLNFNSSARVNNYGVFRIADHTTNIKPNSGPIFNNSGLFEITERGSLETSHTYTQTTGETKVNGVFSASIIKINGGKLSGNGTVVSDFNHSPLYYKATLSPGAPLGTLTLTSKDISYVLCVSCSIDIEIAGASSADHLHVNGSLYMNNWKLNVQLRDGYTPPAGKSFNIISADSISYYGPAPTYNLPKLPAGRTWSVNNNGTTIILTAN